MSGRRAGTIGIAAMALMGLPAGIAEAASVRELIRRGNDLYSGGDHAAALALYAEAMETDPSFVEALYNEACARHQLGEFERAEELFRQVEAAENASPELLARSRYNRGNAIYESAMAGAAEDPEGTIERLKEAVAA
ncbi:MAG: tetratricopeptide repeat protein, partial [Planctomycetota bacterium]|nr:tetratricopeptide repeat protein [Planctomycetota bacterium]